MTGARGRCNCGGVAFRIEGPFEPAPAACHCRECRRMSGHVWAAATAPAASLRFEADATLRWWRSSPRARRGFCGVCGSFLFWRRDDLDSVDVALGALEAPTGLRLAAHIFTAEMGDYYALDDLPAHRGGRDGVD